MRETHRRGGDSALVVQDRLDHRGVGLGEQGGGQISQSVAEGAGPVDVSLGPRGGQFGLGGGADVGGGEDAAFGSEG